MCVCMYVEEREREEDATRYQAWGRNRETHSACVRKNETDRQSEEDCVIERENEKE